MTESPKDTEANHVLVVDDDLELCELLSIRLAAGGYRVSLEHGVAKARARLGRERIDALLLDLRLSDGDGFDVLEAVRQRSPDVPVVILTAHGTIDIAVEAIKRGAFGFITKPFHDHDLLQKLAHAVESHKLKREVASLRRMVGGNDETTFVGASRAVAEVREWVNRVAPTDVTVLVLGESGTGKELVARSIHASSQRSKAPFVSVNCAALAPELLESTLFGHTKGAFTGATSDREGLVGAAKGGTLFLDEVAETPPLVQAKLLRVLQEKRFNRVGSTTEDVADVRIIAATNRDLRQEVAERRFREDLFYRLHVLPLTVPPLRDRREDILLLAELFVERAAARNNVPAPTLGPSACAALMAHSWPGNVRELLNVMEAAALLAAGGEVNVDQLPGVGAEGRGANVKLDAFERLAERMFEPYVSTAQELPTLRDARDAVERSYLDVVLQKTGGNVASAARLAGRNRTDFYDLLRRHGRSPSAARGGGTST
ncbi:MAG: sigma-54 dependent transcriptional regulator [Polyangiaceae bacterium]